MVVLPDPGEGMLAGLKVTVTPVRAPLLDIAMALLNPPEGVAVMTDDPLDPVCTVTDAGLGVRVKLGELPEVTVKETDVDAVTPSPLPVTVIA